MTRNTVRSRLRNVLLAIDQGTTQTKAVLVSLGGGVLAEAAAEFPQHYPRPGWVEHEPEEIWASVRRAVRDVSLRARCAPSRILAVGITNQRETTLVWDSSSGRPLGRAIVWQDRRTSPQCAELKARGLERRVREITGLVIDPYFSATKLSWILRHDPAARKAASAGTLRFGTVDTYLLYRLSGGRVHATDVSNASRTLLLNLKDCRWDSRMLDLFKVPPSVLPEVRASDQVFGETRGLDFLPDGIPIAGILGDQQAALFGQACFGAGDAKCTYGTGAFLLMNVGRLPVASRSGLLSTAAWRLSGKTTYALEGSVFIAGAAVQWLRDGLGLIRSSAEVEKLARSVKDSGGVVLVPAFTGLGAPHWRPEARGLLSGITRGTTAGHVARATLEGVAFQCADVLRAMEQDTGRRLKTLKVDGGAAANDLLLEFQADILQRTIVRPKVTSITALGTALLAGLTVGAFPSLTAIRQRWEEDRRFQPRKTRRQADRAMERWRAALERV